MKLFDRNHYAVLYSDRCNYRCYYCNNNVPLKAPKSVVEGNVETLIGLFKRLDPGVLFLSGGEPLFWEDMPRLLESLPEWYWLLFTNLSVVPKWLSHPNIKLLIPSFHVEHAKPESFFASLTKVRDLGKRSHVKLLVKPGDEYAQVKLWEQIQGLGVPASFTPLGRGFLTKPAFVRDVLTDYRTSCLYSSRFFSSSDAWHTQCPAGTKGAFQINASGEIVRCSSNYDRIGNLLEEPERIVQRGGAIDCGQAAMCCSEWHYFGEMTPANENERWQHYIETGHWQPPTLGELYRFVLNMDLNPARRNPPAAPARVAPGNRTLKPVAALCQRLETTELPKTEAILASFGRPSAPEVEKEASPGRSPAACLAALVAQEEPTRVLDLSKNLGTGTLALLHAMKSVELFVALPREVSAKSLGLLFNHFDCAQASIPNWAIRNQVATDRIRIHPAQILVEAQPNPGEAPTLWHRIPEVVRLLNQYRFDFISTDQAKNAEQLACVIAQFWPFLAPGGLFWCSGLTSFGQDPHHPSSPNALAELCRKTLARLAPEIADSCLWVESQEATEPMGAQPALLVRKKPGTVNGAATAAVDISASLDLLASLGLDLAGRSVLEATGRDCGLAGFLRQLGCTVLSCDQFEKLDAGRQFEIVTSFANQSGSVSVADLFARLAPRCRDILVMELRSTNQAQRLDRQSLLDTLKQHFAHAYLTLKSALSPSARRDNPGECVMFVGSRAPLDLPSLTPRVPLTHPPLEPLISLMPEAVSSREGCAAPPPVSAITELEGEPNSQSLRVQLDMDAQELARAAEVNVSGPRTGRELSFIEERLTFSPRSKTDHVATPSFPIEPPVGPSGGWAFLELEFPMAPEDKTKRSVVVVQRESFQEMMVVPAAPEPKVKTLVQLFANTTSFRLVFLSRGQQPCLLPHRLVFSQILPPQPLPLNPLASTEKAPTPATEALELAITDFCNLKCNFCSQATPLHKDKKVMDLDSLRRISQFFKPNEFREIKLSGGEPTLHPEFRGICQELKTLFPSSRYVLATNGFRLEHYLDVLGAFDLVDLSQYPGSNDDLCKRLRALNLPNVAGGAKYESVEMLDVNLEQNHGKREVFAHCPHTKVKKVVQGRIYPCCVAFGLATRRGVDTDKVSVPLDSQWRENLAKLRPEGLCRRCFVEVSAPANAADHKTITEETSWTPEVGANASLLLDVSSAPAFARLLKSIYAKPAPQELAWDGTALVFTPSTDKDHYMTEFRPVRFPEHARKGSALLEVDFPETGQRERVIVGVQDEHYTLLGKSANSRRSSVVPFSRNTNAIRLLFLTPSGKPCIFPALARLSVVFE